jgi:hypothetical protein
LLAAARIKNSEDQIRRPKSGLRMQFEKCFDFGGGIFEDLL